MSHIPSRSHPQANGDASPTIPQTGSQAHPEFCAPHPHPHCLHPVASSLCTLLTVAPASFGRRLVSMLENPAASVDHGETTTLSFGSSLREAKRGCGHSAWGVAKSRESVQLKILLQEGARNTEQAYSPKVWESLRISSKMMEGISFQKSVKKAWRRRLLLRIWSQQHKTWRLQAKNLLHSKRNQQHNEKSVHWMGENIWESYIW